MIFRGKSTAKSAKRPFSIAMAMFARGFSGLFRQTKGFQIYFLVSEASSGSVPDETRDFGSLCYPPTLYSSDGKFLWIYPLNLGLFHGN